MISHKKKRGKIRRNARAIGFGENGDSVGVNGVLNEGGNRIRGLNVQCSKPQHKKSERHRYDHTPP